MSYYNYGRSYRNSSSSSSYYDSNNFEVDGDGYTKVYTDGACSNNGQANPKAGLGVFFKDGSNLNVSRRVEGRATSTNAEIRAASEAAKLAKEAGIEKLKICTDSTFLKDSCTKWMPNWERNGWKKYDGSDVVNKKELIELKNELRDLDVKWEHVRGHNKVYGNEQADKLARSATRDD